MQKISPGNAKQLLGAWLQGDSICDIERFEPIDFPDEENLRELYEHIAKGRDSAQIVKASTYFNYPILSQLMTDYVPTFYASVLATEIRRKSINLLHSVNEDADMDQLVNIVTEAARREKTILVSEEPDHGYVEMVTADLKEARERRRIPYGLASLDMHTGGVHRKELTIVAARPGIGKSAFALQVANKIQSRSEKVLFFNLEMTTLQNIYRLATAEGFATRTKIRNGTFTDDEAKALKVYVSTLEEFDKLHFYEGVNDLYTIQSIVRKEKPLMIVIDQLTQLQASGNKFNTIREQMSFETTFLKRMAMEENIAVMLLCQINRAGASSKPTAANLKESGRIEEDADNIILLHRLSEDECPGKYTGDDIFPILVAIEKQRDGETGEFVCGYNAPKLKFFE